MCLPVPSVLAGSIAHGASSSDTDLDAMSDDDDGDDDWDFYPCLVDDRPASIFLNLRYDDERPPEDTTTLYRIRLPMAEPEDHGMGSAAEALAMNALEDEMVQRAEAGGLLAKQSFIGSGGEADDLEARRMLRDDVQRLPTDRPRGSQHDHPLHGPSLPMGTEPTDPPGSTGSGSAAEAG